MAHQETPMVISVLPASEAALTADSTAEAASEGALEGSAGADASGAADDWGSEAGAALLLFPPPPQPTMLIAIAPAMAMPNAFLNIPFFILFTPFVLFINGFGPNNVSLNV
jgi:hypothetical protein